MTTLIPKPNENTVTGILKEKLERRQVKVVQFASLDTPVGRREPDLLCQNAGAYPIEAKFAEAQLVDAIAKIQNDYLKHYRLLALNGGFAILYPKQLSSPMPLDALRQLAEDSEFRLVAMFPPEDARPFTVHEGKLAAIADEIANYVLQPPKRVEPSLSYIIKALQETANYIVLGLRHLSGRSLREFFGGETVFNYILQYEEGQYPEEDLRLAASYLLVNQLLFYHVLSRTRKEEFPEIDADALRQPSQLETYFQKVLDINYKPVFAFKVASLVPPKFKEEVKKIVNVVQGLAPEKVGGDLLGTIFHDLIPFEVRKTVAAFYTNVLVAELLATLAVNTRHAKVADFAVGSGGLLVAAYRRKRLLLGRALTQEDHRRFVEEELYGVDVMPFAANVAACHLALQSPQFIIDRANIAIWDSTDLRPGLKIPSVADVGLVLTGQSTLDSHVWQLKKAKGVVKLRERETEQEIELQPLDVVMMNPPFTRQQRIPPQYKEILSTRFNEYESQIHGQMGYHGYFMLLADRMLKNGGRMALVLPASVLNADGFMAIRKFLADNYQIEHIVTTYQRAAFSESAQFREILLVAKKLGHKSDGMTPCAITVLKTLPQSSQEAHRLAGEMSSSLTLSQFGVVKDDERLTVRVVSMGDIRDSADNLFRLIAFSDERLGDIWERLLKKSKGKLVKFGNYLDEIDSAPKEGVALGQMLEGGGIGSLYIHVSGSRTLKKSDVWVAKEVGARRLLVEHKALRQVLSVPIDAVRPAMRRFSGLNVIDIENELDYMIVNEFPNVDKFISFGLGKKLPKGFFKKWKGYVESILGNLSMAYHVDVSASGTSLLAYYSPSDIVTPRNIWSIKIPDRMAKVYSMWLNSTTGLLQILMLRKETRGAYIRIDASIIRDLLLPNPRTMSEKDFRKFEALYDRLRVKKFPSILEQLRNCDTNRKALDRVCLEYMGIGNQEIDELTAYLYPSLANEIEILKRLMR